MQHPTRINPGSSLLGLLTLDRTSEVVCRRARSLRRGVPPSARPTEQPGPHALCGRWLRWVFATRLADFFYALPWSNLSGSSFSLNRVPKRRPAESFPRANQDRTPVGECSFSLTTDSL